MFLHLSLSTCITDKLSSLPSSWKAPSLPASWRPNIPSSWTANGRRYLHRLPALRISNVLSTSAEPSAPAGDNLGSPTRSRVLWDQSVALAKRLADMWTMAIAAQRAWQVTSYQHLARLGLFRVVSEIEADLLMQLETLESDSDMDFDADESDFDILRFVEAAGLDEVKVAKMLADLSDMAYDVSKVTPERLVAAYGLQLVTTSLNLRAAGAGARPAWANPEHASAQQQASSRQQQGAAPRPSPSRASNIVPVPQHWRELRASSPARSLSPARAASAELVISPAGSRSVSPARAVSPSRARPEPGPASDFAFIAPQCSSCSQASGGGCPGSCSSHTSSSRTRRSSMDRIEAASVAAFAQETISLLEHDLEEARARQSCKQQRCAQHKAGAEAEPAVGTTPAGEAAPDAHWPAHWLVCDDHTNATRYVIIQGSVTVDHWRINLQIDPVPFEDPFLGIKVHRGMYQAALNLYDQLLPSVQEYVAANPDGRICFSGHSLGGSLATLLMALYVHRGVLQQHNVAPVHTFGAPAVFCHGAGSYTQEDSCTSCSLSCQMAGRNDTVPHPQGGLLAMLGLPAGSVRNIIMHRDIVPRAFMCDYTIVADLLQRWVPSFKSHKGLAAHHSHKVLYTFVGDMQVLQPSTTLSFVRQGEDHGMLPPGAALYKLVQPLEDSVCSLDQEEQGQEGQEGSSCGLLDQGTATVSDAMLEFMNSPHPMETLSDPRAYGHQGMISRYHNPVNYAHALSALLP